MHKEIEVIQFVKDKLWEPKGGLTAESSLFHDLGVDGQDAIEFLEEFCVGFGIPKSSIIIQKHFGPEASPNPFTFFRWIFANKFREGKDLIPIRVKDLIVSAQNGRWNIKY